MTEIEKGRKNILKSDDVNELEKLINKQIKRWDVIRDSRINASDRLYSYDASWDIMSLIFNIEAVCFTILALPYGKSSFHVMHSVGLTIFVACVSLYIILVQYFISLRRYDTRALQYHYQQIEIKRLSTNLLISIQRFKANEFGKEKLISKYNDAINSYYAVLEGTENHALSDFENAKVGRDYKGTVDYSADRLFICFNKLVAFAFVIMVSWFVWF